MAGAILVVNTGSSSIKFGLFGISATQEPVLQCSGLVDGHESASHLTIKDRAGNVLADRERLRSPQGEDRFDDILRWIDAHLAGDALLAVGHRVVHGGPDFVAPVTITKNIIDTLDALAPLAPLHQQRCLAPVRAIGSLRPGLRQIACFDTAFHHDLAASVRRFAIPRRFDELGIRRYGFHGLSYEFIARELETSGHACKRTVAAHLGSGASLCAMRNGTSIDTTMGMTPLDGLMMGTRCGAIDPGLLLYLQQHHGLSVEELQHMLYHESGLLGVSAISSDIRALLASSDPHAAEAIEMFIIRVARQIAAMATALEGIECLVFTGGIGEHAAPVRTMICERLRWLGVDIDPEANERAADRISNAVSRVEVLVIPTSEETSLARHCLVALSAS